MHMPSLLEKKTGNKIDKPLKAHTDCPSQDAIVVVRIITIVVTLLISELKLLIIIISKLYIITYTTYQ